MKTADSPVKDRISAMSLEHENLTFDACGNALAAMKKSRHQGRAGFRSHHGAVGRGSADRTAGAGL